MVLPLEKAHHWAQQTATSDPSRSLISDSIVGIQVSAPSRCFGRDAEIKCLVDTILNNSRATIVILGGPGIGKTTLAREVANRPEVIERYRERRWFISLENVISRDGLESSIMASLCLQQDAGIDVALRRLQEGPSLIILDNLETPWEADALSVGSLLSSLGEAGQTAIIASMRGREPPNNIRWTLQRHIRQLDESHARQIFLAIAPSISPEDLNLSPLLHELGGIPLAIELTACRARVFNTLDEIWQNWRKKGVAIARTRNTEVSRLTSLEKSIHLSLTSPRLGSASLKLFRLLGQLPGGVAPEDVDALFGDEAFDAKSDLLGLDLVIERDTRLDLLPPIRDYAQRHYAAERQERDRCYSHYLRLAQTGTRIRFLDGRGVMDRVIPEILNIEAALRNTPSKEFARIWPSPIDGYCALARARGVGSPALIQKLAEEFANNDDKLCEAICRKGLGDLFMARLNEEMALRSYTKALRLFREAWDIGGAASCLVQVGQIASELDDPGLARQSYDQALELYKHIEDKSGQASCIFGLGVISEREVEKRVCFETALELFEGANDLVGEGGCLVKLGSLAWKRGQLNEARAALSRAKEKFVETGNIKGEAYCSGLFADIAIDMSETPAARDGYTTAINLFRRVGSIDGEASCLEGLAQIEIEEGTLAAAYASLDRARSLYRQLGSGRSTICELKMERIEEMRSKALHGAGEHHS
jgi:tetratricopeptide (TPR) repeat protein